MKTSFKSNLIGFLVAGLLSASLSQVSIARADESSQSAALRRILSKVAPPELPEQTAKLISQAKPREQKSVAVAAVRIAVEKNPVGAPFIVSAVARAVPAVAADAAAAAVAMEPKQAGLIAKAAAAAAPSKAAEIVRTMSKQAPACYAIIAIGAYEAVPSAKQAILAAVSKSIPQLKPYIEQAAKAPVAGVAPSVASIIQQAESLAATSGSTTIDPSHFASVAPPPGNRPPPFTPAGGTPGESNRNQTVFITPGTGRTYSGP